MEERIKKIVQARKIRRQGVRKAEAFKIAGLSEEYYKKCTRDIWVRKKRTIKMKGFIAQHLFLNCTYLKKEIAKLLGVSEAFVKRHSLNPPNPEKYPSAIRGYFVSEGKTYITMKGLSSRLDFTHAYTHRAVSAAKVPSYVFLANGNNGLRRLKFYEYREVLELIPLFRNKIRRLKRLQFLTNKLIEKCPDDLTPQQYKIHCTLLVLRNYLKYWPSNAEISFAAKLNYEYVRKALVKLESKGYLTIIRSEHGQRIEFIIHKGPAKLITKEIECPQCDHKIRIAYDYVELK